MPNQTNIDPIVVSVGEAQRLSGLGTTKIYELINDGVLKTTKVGQRRLVDFASLKTLLTNTSEVAR